MALRPLICGNCGAQLAPGVKFCRICGAAVQSAASAASTVRPAQPYQPQPQVKNNPISITEANNFARDKLKRGDLPDNVANQLAFVVPYFRALM